MTVVLTLDLNSQRRKRRDDEIKVDPEERKSDPAVLAKAKKQTKAARALLYKPNDEALNQLKIAADRIEAFVQLVDSWDQKTTTVKKDDWKNIDIDNVSVWNHFLFNRQIEGGQLGKDTKKNDQLSIIGKIKNKNGNGHDHAAFLALIGDVGTAIGDYSVKPIPDEKKVKEYKSYQLYKQIFDSFKNFASLSSVPKKDEALKQVAKIQYNQRSGDTITSGNKRTQRGLVFENDDVKTEPARSGVFNVNVDKSIDTELGITDEKELIPATKWPYQTLLPSTMDSCKEEPWAGHYSGSINEVLMIFDWLTYVSSNDENLAHPLMSFELNEKEKDTKSLKEIQNFVLPDYKNLKLNDAKREARAALSAAFLVGGGYHTANEVYFTVKKYLGDKSLAGIFVASCDPSSTDNLSKLFGKYTKSKKKQIKKSN